MESGKVNTFLFFIVLFVQIQLVAQVSVSGKVIDEESKEPLIGAQIILKNGGAP